MTSKEQLLCTPREQLLRIAERLESVAKDLEMRATIDVHQKNEHIGYLRSEAFLIREAVQRAGI